MFNNDGNILVKQMEEIASKLAPISNLRNLVSEVESIVNSICEVPVMNLYLYESISKRLRLFISKGLTPKERRQMEQTAMERHPGTVWRTGKLLYLSREDEESIEFDTFMRAGGTLRSRLFLPVVRNNECIGTFALAHTQEQYFNDRQISLLSFVTNLAGVIYKNIIDTKELNRVNQRLRIANRNFLSQKLQSIGQLAAGIAHEVNTPLQYVGDNINFLNSAFQMITIFMDSVADLLQNTDQYDKSKLINLYEKLRTETDIDFFMQEIPPSVCQSIDGLEKVSKIIRTLKDFAQSGVKDKSFVNINKCIEDTLLITHNEWKMWAEVVQNLNEEMPLLYCQADEINQVLLQIVINAVHAIQEKVVDNPKYKKGRITIKTSFDSIAMKLTIEDDGIGIPVNYIDKIFDPFFTTKGTNKGSGQGLSIAHDVITHKHKGEIKVKSLEGVGSTFTITLPFS